MVIERAGRFSPPFDDVAMDNSPDSQELAKGHAYWRRKSDRIWLVLTLLIAGAGAIAWLCTGNVDHFYWGLFFTVSPLSGFLYTHYIPLNPRRDPVETERRLEVANRKMQKRRRSVALINGAMIVIASPVLFVIGVGKGLEQGIGSAILGGSLGLLFLICGLAAIVWGWRSRGKDPGGKR